MHYHKILKEIFIIVLSNQDIWEKIQQSRQILQQLSLEYANSVQKLDKFEQALISENHLNFLAYMLKNPKIRVDIAYSVLTNNNYELLPEAVLNEYHNFSHANYKQIYNKTIQEIDEMNRERVAFCK